MAKITARNSTELARASRNHTDKDGWEHRSLLVLRSDGAILGKTKLRAPGRNYWSDTSYSIRAKVSADAPDKIAVFVGYATKHGYTVA